MGMKFALLLLAVGLAAGQNFRVCIPSSDRTLCNSLDRDGSQAICDQVESRIDCALRLARGQVDIGVFNEEETLLLAQQQPNVNRVVATIRDVARTEPFAFEAVAVVSNEHTGGLGALQGARYCHPGLDQQDQRWSPRVLRAFEQLVAQTDRCGEIPDGSTAEELEVAQLTFFSAACRPGPWSLNATVDANLKRQYPQFCSLCGANNTCTGYSIDMGVSVAGANNNNRHIQALECLRANRNNTVAYAAWQHVREFFSNRNPEAATSFAVLCPDGSTRTLTTEVLANATAPCSIIRQPWSTIVASDATAVSVRENLRTWWPAGSDPGGNTWQSILFNGVVGGSNARVLLEENLPSPTNYTSWIRPIPAQDATATCVPTRRWCTLTAAEHTKCLWVRAAAYSLGVQPTISCQQRTNTFECLNDIKENRADFIASSSNYGYMARQHYNLSPVKLLQNSRSASSTNSFSRVAAFVKETSAQSDITRFENLRGKRACFPEFGGIAFVAFVRAAHERGVISAAQCDYARAVGEFFGGACAGGALDATHAIAQTDYNATSLCTLCRPRGNIVGNNSDLTCSWDYSSNAYFGNNGSIACLADPAADVAFLKVNNIQSHLSQANLQANQVRALCRNNSLAAATGVALDDNCLLAHVVDAEVVTRRGDPLTNALSVLLESLDFYFGYTAESGSQLINLEIFSPFDGISDLLFRDTAIGLTEPSATSSNAEARNYIELFQHLESCTGAASPGPITGLGAKNYYSLAMAAMLAMVARFVVY